MKAKMYLTVVCLLVFSISIAEALPQYTILDYPGRQGSGGPFIVDPVTAGESNFYTFCIEKTEYLSLGSTYRGSIEPYAVYGGVGGNMNTTDPVSIQTMKLYDYALDNWGTLTITQLTDIQNAIWAWEGEVTYASISAFAQTYYDNANIPGFYTLDRNIMALNLWSADVSAPYNTQFNWDHRVQSLLIAVPEPGILILLGIGLSSLGLLARRKKETV